MAYRDNVQALCNSCNIPNPIDDERLTIQRITFREPLEPDLVATLMVEATKMNCAGRLFIQELARGRRGIFISQNIRARAAEFFTPELWDDCSPEKRTLVYGVKTYTMVEIVYR